jgi:hypothetical protein
MLISITIMQTRMECNHAKYRVGETWILYNHRSFSFMNHALMLGLTNKNLAE